MRFMIILLLPAVLFALLSAVGFLRYKCFGKRLRVNGIERFLISFVLVLIYLVGYAFIVKFVMNRVSGTPLEWYLVFAWMGISLILWCYCEWGFEAKTWVRFADDEYMAIKKISAYSFALIVVFYLGYLKLGHEMGDYSNLNEKVLVDVMNVTIVSGMIAVDRILNQIKNLHVISVKKKEALAKSADVNKVVES